MTQLVIVLLMFQAPMATMKKLISTLQGKEMPRLTAVASAGKVMWISTEAKTNDDRDDTGARHFPRAKSGI